ncbi:helix-turn-helix transcriptional regulator [Microlunatus sp. Gsoil 973]|uniref:helix-turn-helix transcriptional regulator n=1 Tax=Microlunatus sp. Gsoil 973 TaxID=2672569 RepID=UPI0012B4ABB7|nr:helix-turn-helix transcriptional regulator [Microlunatus sp. Gsoil 973]QGN32296.1 helix-turn-helix domain-containing protein [Microlunatus sp. Gsoil 973]
MTTSVRTDLSEFLRAGRARVTAEEAGLPVGSRRRTPGLRREEVAVLAGVGASWYQWLEQGREITVSGQVLDAIARVLRFSNDERRHLYVLAGLNPPLPSPPADPSIGEDITQLLDRWLPHAAHVVDQYWNFVAANDVARAIFGWQRDFRGNCLVDFFTSDLYRGRMENWAETAPTVVATYRHEMTRRLSGVEDDGNTEIVADLTARSPEFAELWSRQQVHAPMITTKTLDHEYAGELVLEGRMLYLPDRPDLTLVLHTPVEGTPTAERLADLMAAARRSSEPAGGLRLVASA